MQGVDKPVEIFDKTASVLAVDRVVTEHLHHLAPAVVMVIPDRHGASTHLNVVHLVGCVSWREWRERIRNRT